MLIVYSSTNKQTSLKQSKSVEAYHQTPTRVPIKDDGIPDLQIKSLLIPSVTTTPFLSSKAITRNSSQGSVRRKITIQK